MGIALVDRTGRQLSLTMEGQQLAEALSAGFGTIARTVDMLTGADAGRPLQISATPSFAQHWLMPRLNDFRKDFPGIDIMLDPTPKIVTFEPGGIDIGIRFGAGDWPGLEARLLFKADIVAVAAPSLVGGRRITDPDELASLPWLQEFGTTEASDWLRNHGATRPRSGGITQVPGNLMLDGLRGGQGVAVTVFQWVQQDIADGRLIELLRDEEDTGYYVVTRPGILRTKAKVFDTWLIRQARAMDQS